MNRGKVGGLDVKSTEHWKNVDEQYWIDCGVPVRPRVIDYHSPDYVYQYKDKRVTAYEINQAMVRLQHALYDSIQCCKDGSIALIGELYGRWYNNKDRRVKDYHRCPYHEDLLPNWEQFTERLSKHTDLGRFCITNIMLPPSPFFSTEIVQSSRSITF